MNRVRLLSFLFVSILGLVPPAGAGSTAPSAPPKRVVSTFLCTDEYVFRLVPRAAIAALSYEATDRHPVVSTIADQAVGIAALHPSVEAVLALHPDLVVMYAGVNPRLKAALDRLRIPVLEVPWANSLDDIRRTTRLIGARLGASDQAEALLRTMDADLAAARAAAPRPPVTALLYQPNGYAQTSGYASELMALAGLRDLAPGIGLTRNGRLPIETVVTAAPQLLILGGEKKSGSALAYQILHHPALAALQGRTLQDYAVLNELMCPGPWSATAAKTFAKLGRKALAQGTPRH